MRKPIFRNLYKIHIYLGIFVAIHFAVFALSGLALLFKDEIQGHSSESSTIIPRVQLAERYDAVLTNALQAYPHDRPLALFPDEDNENVLHARLGIDGATKLRGSRRLAFDLTSAKQVSNETKRDGFFDWMLILHRELFLGSNGKIYLGLVGLAYVFMLLSGFFIYGNFMKGRRFGDIRQARVPKLVDLHKFVGVTTFGWGLIVGLSGVFLAFNGVLIKLFLLQSLKHLSEQYQDFSPAVEQVASVKQVINAALDAQSDSIVSYVSFPDTEFGIPGHYLILINGTGIITQKISRLAVVNAQTGSLSEIIELPLYLKIVLLSEPLHFGDYGGLFLKIIWALFAVGSLAVALFGVSSFFMKRRKVKPVMQSPKRLQRPMSWSYAIPTFIFVITALGITNALFSVGLIAQVSIAVLLIPLLVIFFGRKRNV